MREKILRKEKQYNENPYIIYKIMNNKTGMW